jgi:hypothetical protein
MTAAHTEPAPPDDARDARRQLAALLAGAKDLDRDCDSTIELAEYLQSRRAAGGLAVDVESVLLDLEASLRAAPPPLLPDVVCGTGLSGAELTAAVDRARTEFDRRIPRAPGVRPNRPAGPERTVSRDSLQPFTDGR